MSSLGGSQRQLALVASFGQWSVRSVLLPAVLQILGRRGWALPGWLEHRLPRITIDRDMGARPAFEEGT